MFLKKSFLTLATIAGALTIGSATGQAGTVTYETSITISLDACNNLGVGLCMPPDSTDPTLSDVAIVDEAPGFAIAVDYGGGIDAELSNQVVGGFFPISWLPTAEIAIGWLDYLPTDGETPADHVVLFVNHGSISSGQTWASLFPDFAESDIIQELQDLNSSNPTIQEAAAENPILYDFVSEDVTPAMLFTPNNGVLDAVAFSDGSLVGQGTSTMLSSAPEPSASMTLLLGVGCLAFLKWRAAAKQAR